MKQQVSSRLAAGVTMRRLVTALVFAIGAAVLLGCATMSASVLAPVVVRVGRPFLIAESPPYGWGVLSHPRLIKVSDDLIILRYYVGGDNANWNDPGARDIKARSPAFSRDGGKTWVFGEENLDPLIAEYSYYWGYNIPIDGGSIMGAHGKAIRVREGMRVDGEPWPVTTIKGDFNVGLGQWHRGAVMSDGTYVASSYADAIPSAGKKKWAVHLLVSCDSGLTWTVRSLIAGPEHAPWAMKWPVGFEGPNEGTITVLPNDDILCIARVGTKQFTVFEAAREATRMLQAKSSDGGLTWRRKEMAFEGVYPKLCRMQNNVVTLAFGRPGNNLAFSINGGLTWGAEVALTPRDAKTSGYCDVIEVSPGRLLAVFDVHKTDLRGFWLWEPKPQNGIFGVFVDVKRLVPGGGRKK